MQFFLLVIMALLLFAVPFVFFKSVFIKIILWIYAYPIWIMFTLVIGFEPTRILQNIGFGFYSDIVTDAFIYALVSYMLLVACLWTTRNNDITFVDLKLGLVERTTLLVILISFLPIAYPGVFGLSDSRFGSFASVVVLCASFLVVSSSSLEGKRDWHVYALMVISAGMIGFGERVDFILILIAPVLIKSARIEPKLIILGVVVFVLGTLGLYYRAGIPVNFQTIVDESGSLLFNFGTVVDVVHVYLSAFWFFSEIGADFRPILNVLFFFIPLHPLGGASSDFNTVSVLRSVIPNAGGGLLYTPLVMAGGGGGVVLFGLIYAMIIRGLVKGNGYYKLFFVSFFLMQLRLQWYGLSYFGSVLTMGLVLMIFYWLLPKRKSQRLEN